MAEWQIVMLGRRGGLYSCECMEQRVRPELQQRLLHLERRENTTSRFVFEPIAVETCDV